jgi:3-deoxy-D-manno-octulosonate 8-phosphate phosphatase KdsC-like HAD superfamily phosphatase
VEGSRSRQDIEPSNADYVAKRPGGSGAVREVIEYILKKTGKWPELMKRYVP